MNPNDSNVRGISYFVHLGGMRTGSSYLQKLFAEHSEIELRLKTRVCSYDPYFKDHSQFQMVPVSGVVIDSDENYSLGRFKDELIDSSDSCFNLYDELNVVTHNLEKMAKRLADVSPTATLFIVIREQNSWIDSVYRHDIQHFALHQSFEEFAASELGQSYIRAADWFSVCQIYINLFGMSRVKILLFEDLKFRPAKFFADLGGILNLDFSMCQLEHKGVAKNPTYTQLTLVLLRLANRLSEKRRNKPESRQYWYARRLAIYLGQLFGDYLPAPRLIPDKRLKDILIPATASNRELIHFGVSENSLKNYGYIS